MDVRDRIPARRKVTRNLWKAVEVAAVPSLLPDSRSFLEVINRGLQSTFGNGQARARSLHLQAAAVRKAVLSDLNAPAVVRSFARENLRIRDANRYVLDALIDVLLAEDWQQLPLIDEQLRIHLVARTRERHRVHRPILETRLGSMAVVSFSAEVVTPAGPKALDQLVPGTDVTEEKALAVGMWEDDRLARLMGGLDRESRAVVEMVARFPRTTWEEAATLAGSDVSRGEQTRRRLKYIAKEIRRRDRLRHAGTTPGGSR